MPGASSPRHAFCLALLRMGFTELPASPRELVVSYTTVSPLPAEASGLFSVALACGFPRVDVIHHPALRSPDFPRGVEHATRSSRPTRPGINPTLVRMLILLPPSESKTAPSAGPSVDLSDMSFPQLTEAREAMLDRLIEVSSGEDAGDLLKTGPSLAAEVERNTRLLREPTAPALEVYTGVLFDALDHPHLSPKAQERARTRVVIISALWGAVTPADFIPAYRLSMGAKVAPAGTLAAWWKAELGPVLDAHGSGQVIVDCRSSSYAAAWKAPAERTVGIRVERELNGKRQVVSHMAKHYRGEVARILLEAEVEPQSVDDVVEILRPHWQVELKSDGTKGHSLTLVVPSDG
jgi:cytoplasmic iron level regulating protein YaaA (DUF328/UPF0246 family)